jgi:hypothetical protein
MSKLPRHWKSFGTFEGLDSLAGARAKHAVGFQVPVPEINERFLCCTNPLLRKRSG